jgi:hypothetical protein
LSDRNDPITFTTVDIITEPGLYAYSIQGKGAGSFLGTMGGDKMGCVITALILKPSNP